MKASIVLIASSLVTASGFVAPPAVKPSCTPSPSALSAITRRDTLSKVFGTATLSTAAALLSGVSSAQAASNEEQEYNELIIVLKARSDDNKEANSNYAQRANKMSSRDFKDAKSRRPKLM